MRAHDFTKAQQSRGFSFGTDSASAAAALRELADRIESGEVGVDSVCIQSVASNDSFTATLVRLKIYERAAFRETTPREFLNQANRDGALISNETKA